jgi:hypothetical protein
MLKLNKDSKIYLVTPANKATGGSEALHQLGAALIKFRLNAFIYYVPTDDPSPLHPAYKHYKVPFTNKIDDTSENVLIIPEVFDYFELFSKFQKIQKVIWWLSINNFYESYYFSSRKIQQLFLRAANKLLKFIFKEPAISLSDFAMAALRDCDLAKDPIISKVNLHLTQSNYAKDHLLKKNITNVEYLSDYLNEEFLTYNYNSEDREDVILFNPSKGLKFTKKIVSFAPNLKFLPIVNMPRAKVLDIMKKARVYIDFGNHPGRDRMPREAAICGCCVISGKRGAAAFLQDVPLPDKYKFEDKKYNIPAVVSTIKYCQENYKEAARDFDNYRELIKGDKEKFESDVRKIFCKINL